MRVKINGIEIMEMNKTVVIEKELNEFLELSSEEVSRLISGNENNNFVLNVEINEVENVSKEYFQSLFYKIKESNIPFEKLTLNYKSDNEEVVYALQERFNLHFNEMIGFVNDVLSKAFIFPIPNLF